ncbi:MAG: hypothetical protein QOH03_2532, partial [Kribbellaceae bacterium]|nr:hypothetical protein [Kribbellaceae bacterium]
GFESGIDATVDLGTGKVYLFRGDVYLRVDQESNTVDGEVTSIADGWPGFADAGFTDSLTAAVNWGNGKAYFFRGDTYLGYDIASDAAEGGALSIADNWPGLADAGFGDSIEAALNPGNGKVYLFKGDQYVRYDVAGNAADADYPMPIAGNWPGLDEAGFGSSIDAAWVKLGASAPPAPGGALGPGDHVWYFNDQISTDLSIPRAAWFPGSTGPTDYLGHGNEIFNFVIHSDGTIFRGQPHMRNHPGTFAWLNNNPGNLTGVAGGPDYGQYPGKFNWHNFLIFPTRDAGFAAIGAFLRGPNYRDLSIMQAFAKYAPASDGNDPVAYAESVAAGAGLPTSTLIRDLDDNQLLLMQNKIAEVEGAVPGDILTRDSSDLPEVIRSQLA